MSAILHATIWAFPWAAVAVILVEFALVDEFTEARVRRVMIGVGVVLLLSELLRRTVVLAYSLFLGLGMMIRSTPKLVMVILLGIGISVPAAAQIDASSGSGDGARWDVIDGIGYGGLGFGLGLAASWDLESDGFGPPGAALVIVGGATVGGIVAGALIGSRARRAIAAGQPLSGGHRAAVVSGAVAAGATLGALAAAGLINDEGAGTALGSDEQTLTVLVLAGGALGSLYAWKHRHELTQGRVTVAPRVSGDGEYGLRVRVSF